MNIRSLLFISFSCFRSQCWSVEYFHFLQCTDFQFLLGEQFGYLLKFELQSYLCISIGLGRDEIPFRVPYVCSLVLVLFLTLTQFFALFSSKGLAWFKWKAYIPLGNINEIGNNGFFDVSTPLSIFLIVCCFSTQTVIYSLVNSHQRNIKLRFDGETKCTII